MIRKILLLLCIIPIAAAAAQAQDTRRMYFGISAESSWGQLLPQPPYEAGAARFGVHLNLQSLKYLRQWFGLYFGLSLLNEGGYISSGSNPAERYRLQYFALPLGIALTTPLKRNIQFNLQLGAAGALSIGQYGAINDEATTVFAPFYQAIFSMQYHIGQDVYLHVGPSYLRSITSVMDGGAVKAQSIGVRAGIIF
ncbi:MAG: hypothetical protein LBT48_03020 [Prevotellaceae bacterium]|jgi:hypothetical protein|nr:hypothetical protein [Prevotellaceae bacterium]